MNEDNKSFEIKNSKGKILVYAILNFCAAFFLTKIIKIENNFEFYFSLIMFCGFVGSTIYFLFNFLRPNIIIKIDEQGIWVKKIGLTTWQNLDYFYTKKVNKKRGFDLHFIIRPKDSEKETDVNLALTLIDGSDEEIIRNFIEICRGDNKVIDLGKVSDKSPSNPSSF